MSLSSVASPESATTLRFDDTAVAFASRSDAQLQRMYWLFRAMNNPTLVSQGTALSTWALRVGLPVKGLIRATIFAQFCGGETIETCQKTIDSLAAAGIGTILDYSVEGEKNKAAFDATCEETLATIRRAAGNEAIPFSVFKVTGLARFGLLEKKQAGSPLTAEEQSEWERAYQRVERISAEAARLGVRLFFDGEETWIQDVIDQLCYQMMARFNRERPIIWNTYQLYRRASLGNLKEAYAQAQAQGYYLGAKLVRGAYMEKERARAESMGYPDPIQPNKAASDADYDGALLFCLDHLEGIAFCAGTHNEASSKLLALEMEKRGLAHNDERIWFSQLLGMSDNISYLLAGRGYNVAKYVPYGPVEAVIPYLSRRARENTSVAGQSSRELNLIVRERQRRARG